MPGMPVFSRSNIWSAPMAVWCSMALIDHHMTQYHLTMIDTLRPRCNGRHWFIYFSPDDISKCIVLGMKSVLFRTKLYTKTCNHWDKSTICQHWFSWWLGAHAIIWANGDQLFILERRVAHSNPNLTETHSYWGIWIISQQWFGWWLGAGVASYYLRIGGKKQTNKQKILTWICSSVSTS